MYAAVAGCIHELSQVFKHAISYICQFLFACFVIYSVDLPLRLFVILLFVILTMSVSTLCILKPLLLG